MVSFTDTPLEYSETHRLNYGEFGIAVDKKWAINHGASKVLYIGKDTPVFASFKALFTGLKPKLVRSGQKGIDDVVYQLVSTKKEFSESLGYPFYADLLDLHEFMQTDEDIAESEWRIMRNHKLSWSEGMTLNDVKIYLLRCAKKGVIPSLTIKPHHVNFLVCPDSQVDELQASLKDEWSKVVIKAT